MLVTRGLSFDDLVEYTDWQRGKWREWFRDRPEALAMSTGDHADRRFATVGEVVKHIFGAERTKWTSSSTKATRHGSA
jgi:hypothetical protein